MKLRTLLAGAVAGVALAATGTAPGVAVASVPQSASAPQSPSANCYVDSNGTLHCANGTSDLRSGPHFPAPVVSRLTSTYSYFSCWTSGDAHSGGNNIWYYTDGDDGGHGFLPAQRVHTPQDPMPGMWHC